MPKRSRVIPRPASASVLPDFKSPANLLYLFLGIAALAAIYSLAAWQTGGEWLVQFGLVLFFFLWVGLVSVALLQVLRSLPALARRWQQAMAVPLVLGLATALVTLVVIYLLPSLVTAPSPGELLLRNVSVSLVLGLMLARLLVVLSNWKERVVAESSKRLDALQARIRPHFMFNSLNAIAELVHADPGHAEEALLDLSDLLRTALSESPRHALADELDLVRGYLRIEKLRLGDRLEIEWVLPDKLPEDLEIPALILQPLVENAVVHGIAARPDGGKLTIRAQRMSFKRLRFEIENPIATDANARRTAGHGMGVNNIKQRLALAYEERASLKTWQHDGRFHAALTVPLDA